MYGKHSTRSLREPGTHAKFNYSRSFDRYNKEKRPASVGGKALQVEAFYGGNAYDCKARIPDVYMG